MRRSILGLTAAGLVAAAGNAAGAAPPAWDQVENITEAARHIASLQRKQGAQKAIAFIDACYRTHGLASEYTRAFEACIARDYMFAQALAALYSRLPAAELSKHGIAQPEAITRAMGQRVAAAFKQYDVAPDDAESFRLLVEKHGFPLVMRILFPGTTKPGADQDGAAGGTTKGDEKR